MWAYLNPMVVYSHSHRRHWICEPDVLKMAMSGMNKRNQSLSEHVSAGYMSDGYMSDCYMSDSYMSDSNMSDSYMSDSYMSDGYMRWQTRMKW